MTLARRDWDEPSGPAAARAALADRGIAWVRAPALVEIAERDPWAAAERFLGEPPLLVERQPIRAVAGGRSFASGAMAAPFHTDSQLLFGVPPHVQVMACHRAADRGGEALYLDTWPLLERIEAADRALYDALFEVPRRLPFVFGDLVGPTVTLRGGSVVFSHTARPLPDDPVAERLRPYLDASPVIEVRAEAGDILAIHNHRLLHGRRAFEDPRRAYTRVLVWRAEAWPAPPPLRARADAAGAVSPAGGLAHDAWDRLAPVLALLRGVPAGVIAARTGLPEPELYARRDAVLRAAMGALD